MPGAAQWPDVPQPGAGGARQADIPRGAGGRGGGAQEECGQRPASPGQGRAFQQVQGVEVQIRPESR